MKIKCSKHPKFNGKKQPKTQCLECLSIYFMMKSAPRAPHKPTRMIPDKTKYNQKKKVEYNY